VLIAGLRRLGHEVTEFHRPVWERQEHKAGSFLRPGALARAGAGFAGAWAAVAADCLRHRPRPHAVVAGYPAQADAMPAWTLARAARSTLVADCMVSLADTLAGDRGLAGARAGAALAGADRVTMRLADVVLCDTDAHALYFHERFGVPWAKLVTAPVGAEPERFPPAPQPGGPPHALFYGKLSPLHGLDTVLGAAGRPGVPPIRIIGDGQLRPWLEERLPHAGGDVSWERWVPYESLGARVRGAGICLGIFGRSDKAARVVPNKVWQAMAVGRPVVTADTPGVREVIRHEQNGLLVPAGDADALAAALRRLAADPGLRARLGAAARATYLRAGTPAAAAAPLAAALRARSASLPGR
jgi:hypothetical protein